LKEEDPDIFASFGMIGASEPFLCKVCPRRFPHSTSILNFHEIINKQPQLLRKLRLKLKGGDWPGRQTFLCFPAVKENFQVDSELFDMIGNIFKMIRQ
jgi:hypothetical protein